MSGSIPSSPVEERGCPAPAGGGLDPLDVTRAVVSAQMVFTIGHVLTTGGFLYYFAHALQPTALLTAVLLVTPEVSETIAVLTRPVVQRLGSRKRTWLIGFILARIAALGIPLMALPEWRPAEARVAFGVIVASLALMHVFQSIAYTAYISWLSDLSPREHWGKFFALRQISNVAVLTLLPAGATLLRRSWGEWLTDDGVRNAYLGVFLAGNLCLWLTIPPLCRLPDVPVRWTITPVAGLGKVVSATFASRSMRWVLASSLWLAAAQGLTQSAFFRYQVDLLRVPLEAYLALSAVMYALQIPWSWWGGWLSDRLGDRRPLMIGLVVASGAMGFWLLARPGEAIWLLGAYALWGLFGLVNVCQRNLLLRVAPPSDNTLPLATLEQVAGFVAGVAGLAGGWTLDQLLASRWTADPRGAYVVLFVISWIGRATAALFLVPVRETPARTA